MAAVTCLMMVSMSLEDLLASAGVLVMLVPHLLASRKTICVFARLQTDEIICAGMVRLAMRHVAIALTFLFVLVHAMDLDSMLASVCNVGHVL